MLDLCLHLVSQLWWSDQVRLCSPPEVYSEVLGNDPERSNDAVRSMRRVWELWMHWQNLVWHRPDIKALLDDLQQGAAIRIMFMMFERGRWSPTYLPARRVLRGQVDVLPDNKCVEDLHLGPKTDSKSKVNRKMRTARIQDQIMNSKALSSRGIHDAAEINRETFLAEYAYADKKYKAGRHNPSRPLLKKSWSKFLGKKDWPTVSEEVLRRNSAAFAWMQHYADVPNSELPPKLDAARFAALCPCFALIRRCIGSDEDIEKSVVRVLPTYIHTYKQIIFLLSFLSHSKGMVCMRFLPLFRALVDG